uniref:Secreted protein n=1 Tax=Ixodes ricinus TaxID=34613 RepID=A0A6B0V1F7_IXORI
MWPHVAAAWSGVHCSLSLAFTLAPKSMSSFIISSLSSMQHWCKAVSPSSLVESGLTPSIRRRLTSSTSFLAAASSNMTLGTKWTLYSWAGAPARKAARGPALPLPFCRSRSCWVHFFSCCWRRLRACLSRSCVLIFSTTHISVTSSLCSAIAPPDAPPFRGCWPVLRRRGPVRPWCCSGTLSSRQVTFTPGRRCFVAFCCC